jgi:hypothetical protein
MQEDELATGAIDGAAAGDGSVKVPGKTEVIERRRRARMAREAMPKVPSGPSSLHRLCMVLVIDPDAGCALRIYDRLDAVAGVGSAEGSAEGRTNPIPAPLAPGARLHVVFARPKIGLTADSIRDQVSPLLPVVVCRVPCFGSAAEDPVLLARAIAALQCHNSNGVLWPCVREAARQQGLPIPAGEYL